LQTSNYSKAWQFHIKPWSMTLSYLRDDCHKQAVLIFESRGNSNRCTPSRGKPDQHATSFPHSVCVWPSIIRISHSPHIATFHESLTALDRVTVPEKNGSQHNPQHVSWPIRGSVPSFSPESTNKVVEKAKHLSIAGYSAYRTHITDMRSVRSILARGGQPISS
jgi:hypothetical protein